MKAEFLYGTSVMTLPSDVKKFISRASSDDIKVLVALAAGEGASAEALARVCGITETAVNTALAFWRGAGIIKTDDNAAPLPPTASADSPAETKKPAAPRSYGITGEEIGRICSEHPELKSTIDKCQTIMGKVFTFAESGVIIYLYDHLRLDCEYILLLCSYCRKQGHDSMRYFERSALGLFDRGIDTVQKLEKYFIAESKRGDYEFRLRKLYGLGERALTAREREYIDTWTMEWEISFELVEAAYEEMMRNLPQPKFSYENKILKNWHEAGIKTVDEAKEQGFIAEQGKRGGAKKAASEPSFDIDEFFNLAVERGKANAGTNKK